MEEEFLCKGVQVARYLEYTLKPLTLGECGC